MRRGDPSPVTPPAGQGLGGRWLVPALLALVQLAVWPAPQLLTGTRPPVGELAVGLVVTGVVATVLGWRHRAPLPVLFVVAVISQAGLALTAGDALAVVTFAVLVAVFHLAAQSSTGRALLAVAGVICLDLVVVAVGSGLDSESLATVGADGVGYLLAAGLGQSWRRWRAGRRAAAARLAAAEAARAAAARNERERLAHELHDATAHQLTTVYVAACAAQRSAHRPDLADAALSQAVHGAEKAAETLRQLLAVLATGPPEDESDLVDRLGELAAGFERLDQPVRLQVGALAAAPAPAPGRPARPTREHQELIFTAVREALTNSVRYAPGAPVLVDAARTTDHLTVTVTNPAASRPAVAGRLGSGRGLTGLQARARQLGGELTAGPCDGGWRVRLQLPDSDLEQPARPRVGRGVPGVVRDRWVDLALLLLAVELPVVAMVFGEPVLAPPGTLLLVGVLATVHALPLWWRRRGPTRTLGLLLLTTLLWPVAAATGLASPDALFALGLASIAEAIAVYTVATTPGRRWAGLAAAGAAAWLAAIFTAAVVLVGALPTSDPELPGELLVGVAVTGLLMLFAFGPATGLAWAVGAWVRRRRQRVLDQERDAVLAADLGAHAEAYAERLRLTPRLRDRVAVEIDALAAAAGRPGRAADQQLSEVAEAARLALAAMRELLGGTDADPPSPPETLAVLPGGAQRRFPDHDQGVDR